MHTPTKSHWAAVKRILRYFKGMSSYGIHLTRGSSLSLHGFTDAVRAGSVDDRKSTRGYIVFLSTTLVSWKSGKQCTVAYSSTEAKYKALVDGTAEVLWLHYLLTDLCFPLVLLLLSSTIIWVLLMYLLIRFLMLEQKMLKLIITLFVTGWPKRRFRFASSPPKIN